MKSPDRTLDKTPNKIRIALLYALIPSLFFFFHPIFYLGPAAPAGFKFPLPLIVLILFTLSNLPAFSKLLRFHPKWFPLILLFPSYFTLSIIWSSSPLHTLFTSGIIWCLTISLLTIPEIISNQKIKNKIVKLTFITTIIICAFCWLQCILDLAGLSQNFTLLCDSCTYRAIGFTNPNGSAFDSQLMGDLLLVPAFFCLYLIYKNATQTPQKSRNLPLILLTFFIIATIFITFSRDAVYILLVSIAIIIAVTLIRSHTKRSRPSTTQETPATSHPSSTKYILTITSITAAAFTTALISQGAMTALNPTSDTFTVGIGRSLSHLTFGRIELFPEERNVITEESRTAAEDYIRQTEAAGGQIISDITITSTTFSGEPQNNSPDSSTTDTADAATLFTARASENTKNRTSLIGYIRKLWNNSLVATLIGIILAAISLFYFLRFLSQYPLNPPK